MLESVVPQLEQLNARMQRLEDRFDHLETASDERIDGVITEYLKESSYFRTRVFALVDDWMDNNDETPDEKIKRAVSDMINSGDIVVSIDTI